MPKIVNLLLSYMHIFILSPVNMFVVFADSTISNMAYRLRRSGYPYVYVGICILVICCCINYFVRYSIDFTCIGNSCKRQQIPYIATLCVKIM